MTFLGFEIISDFGSCIRLIMSQSYKPRISAELHITVQKSERYESPCNSLQQIPSYCSIRRVTLLKNCDTQKTAKRNWRFRCVQPVQGGPRKVKPTTILLVTFECVGKIHWFLADVICIQQEVQDHPIWPKWPGLSPGCWVATCLARSRWHSDATGTRWCSKPCDFVA